MLKKIHIREETHKLLKINAAKKNISMLDLLDYLVRNETEI